MPSTNKLYIDLRVFLIDDPPTHNVRLVFVHRRREAPKSFFAHCLQTEYRLYAINYEHLTLYLFCTRKSGGAKLLSGPPTVLSGGASGPPVTAPLQSERKPAHNSLLETTPTYHQVVS
jgi:hypothetical protein